MKYWKETTNLIAALLIGLMGFDVTHWVWIPYALGFLGVLVFLISLRQAYQAVSHASISKDWHFLNMILGLIVVIAAMMQAPWWAFALLAIAIMALVLFSSLADYPD